ncbi:hypothetical protein EYF80_017953 [Liparis tanakae]|uniref:Uncharacterized protein n=1 Tax=Liparis tanakae TaxID=230148 RepID=A0A4Z2I3E7_9TELE|nr:hypothetical protein EYF80_017953 [Liparis tanakae]
MTPDSGDHVGRQENLGGEAPKIKLHHFNLRLRSLFMYYSVYIFRAVGTLNSNSSQELCSSPRQQPPSRQQPAERLWLHSHVLPLNFDLVYSSQRWSPMRKESQGVLCVPGSMAPAKPPGPSFTDSSHVNTSCDHVCGTEMLVHET